MDARSLVIDGGILATVPDDLGGYGNGNCSATIDTNKLQVNGDDIYINYGAAAHVSFGSLQVLGDVTWAGGTYHPYVWGDVDRGDADVWFVGGAFTVGGTAALDPVSIAGEWTPTPPTAGYQWTVIQSIGNLTVANGTPTINGQVWEVVTDANTKTLRVKAK